MEMITSKTTLSEVLKHPGAKEILSDFNLPCLNCPMMALEMKGLTLGEACQMYNLNLKRLLEKLNKVEKYK